jgi:hypothetical protein
MAHAATVTYTGLLITETRDPPIPIIIELEQSRLKVSGRVTTSTPLTGEGRIVDGRKKGYECTFKADLGVGRTLTVDGFCLSRTLEGKFTLQFLDGTHRHGEFRLNRADVEKSAASSGSEEVLGAPTRTTAACLAANAACLAACPRGDYNAEFVCSNRCRLRLVSCRGKAAAAVESPAESAAPLER